MTGCSSDWCRSPWRPAKPRASVPAGQQELKSELARIADGLAEALESLREIARGIHPAVLSEYGLGPAVKALARRSPVPVRLHLAVEGRLAGPVEAGAYYIICEALTNVAKPRPAFGPAQAARRPPRHRY